MQASPPGPPTNTHPRVRASTHREPPVGAAGGAAGRARLVAADRPAAPASPSRESGGGSQLSRGPDQGCMARPALPPRACATPARGTQARRRRRRPLAAASPPPRLRQPCGGQDSSESTGTQPPGTQPPGTQPPAAAGQGVTVLPPAAARAWGLGARIGSLRGLAVWRVAGARRFPHAAAGAERDAHRAGGAPVHPAVLQGAFQGFYRGPGARAPAFARAARGGRLGVGLGPILPHGGMARRVVSGRRRRVARAGRVAQR
jgi:hypothetical protein